MLKRPIKPHIAKALDMYPVVILTGSRQVGKSTLAYEFVKEKGFAYVSLDNICLLYTSCRHRRCL